MAILDQYGRPLQQAALREPQSAGVGPMLYQLWATHPTRGLTPGKLAAILEEAERGYLIAQHDLFREMEEKDGHLYAEMSKRRRAMLTLSWDIVPPPQASAAEVAAAQQVSAIFDLIPDLEDIFVNALDAIGHGFACLELQWTRLGKTWLPRTIEHRPQTWFQTDWETRTEIRLRDGTYDGAALTPFGWIKHVHRAKPGYISRAGLHRVLAWPYLFKLYSLRDLAEFLEIYGLPLRLGHYPPGATPAEKESLLAAVMGIGHNAAGIIPEGMAIDFQKAAEGAKDPFEAMINWCETTQSKAVLGATLTTQTSAKGGGAYALGQVHEQVRLDILESDARQLESTLTRDLVWPITALNTALTDPLRTPRLSIDTQQPEDLELYSKALPPLVAIGLRIPEAWARERLDIPAPEGDEAVLQAAAPIPQPPPTETGGRVGGVMGETPPPTAAGKAALPDQTAAAFPDQHALDALVNSLPDADLQAQMEQTLAPVLQLLRDTHDPAAAMQHLAETYPRMDTAQLEELLARCLFVSELWGRVNAATG